MGYPRQFTKEGEDQWHGKGGVVQVIKDHLGIKWKRQHVKNTLDKTLDHFTLGKLHKFDAGKEGPGNGVQLQRKKKLSDKEIQLALKTVRDALGLGAALRRINQCRRLKGEKGVCYETVRRSLECWGAIYMPPQADTEDRQQRSFQLLLGSVSPPVLSAVAAPVRGRLRAPGPH